MLQMHWGKINLHSEIYSVSSRQSLNGNNIGINELRESIQYFARLNQNNFRATNDLSIATNEYVL